MRTKKLLLLLSLIISLFVFYQPVQAEETNPMDSAVVLSPKQTLSGSFDGTASASLYYKIEISQKTGITVYGTNTGEGGISLRLVDIDGKYVDHQSSAISANSDYSWRTKEIDPGTYYIAVSSHFDKIDYNIAYSLEPFPEYTELTQDTKKDCPAGKNIFKINISSPTAITIYGDQDIQNKVDIHLSNANGSSVTIHSANSTGLSQYKNRTEQLSPGIYYIVSSSEKNYTINYSTELYPEAITLDRGNAISGSFSNTNSKAIYKINVTESQSITYTVNKDNSSYIDLRLCDENSNYIDHLGQLTKDLSFKWSPDKVLSPGTYYLEVGSTHSESVNYNIMWQISGPSAVDDLKMSKATGKAITLKWSGSKNASQYKVYKYDTKNQNYVLYKTVSSTSCKISGLKAATTYTFKITPISVIDGENIEGDETVFKAATAPGKVVLKNAKRTASSTVSGIPLNYYKISWKKVKKAKCYQIYVKTKGSKWKKIEDTSSRSSLIYIVKGFSGQIKVRAYISTDDAVTYGPFSKIKTVKSN